MKMNTASSSGSRTLPSNTITNPKEDLKGVTTRSGNVYQGPMIPTTSSSLPQVVERKTEATKDTVPPTNNESTKDVQPAPKPNPKPSIPYPSRLHDQKLRDKANDQKEKIFHIFKYLDFNISFADALNLMPKFGPTIKSLLTNKDKLFKLARTSLNEHCSAVLLKKLPEKLRDPNKFLIPCDFLRMDECLALADLGASINLMPLSLWNKLSLPGLAPTLMTLKLENRSISRPIGVAEDVFVKVGKFHFPTDFIVVDFDANSRVPLILGRSFLKTGRALIDVYAGELTLRVNNEAVTFNLDQTSRYSANYNDMMANRIDVIDMACEEYCQEVLGFSDVIASVNPTPYYDPIVSTSSPTLTPFGDSDFLLEEVNAFLALEDDPTSREVDHSYYDTKGDILLLEAFLNDDPSLPPPTQGMYLPQVELKDLSPHLEYEFLEGDDKFPVIISKDLSVGKKDALIKVLKSHKQAIAWKLSDIKGINPEFCTHMILIEDDFKPAVQHQRRVNLKIQEVIKKEVLKLLDVGLIYPISDSPWGSVYALTTEKSHFIVKEGIVLGHKISKNGIEVDKAKVDVVAKLPYPTTVKELLAVVYAFEKFRPYLVLSKSIVYTDHSALKYLFNKQDAKPRLLRWVLLLQEFDITIRDKKGAENLAADHLSRLENPHQICKIFNVWGIDFMGPFSSLRGNKYILVAVDYLSKWVEVKALPTNDARVVCKILKSHFARFGTPRAIISDRGTYFCNDQFVKVMLKYGVTYHLATPYHPQISRQLEVSNHGLKQSWKGPWARTVPLGDHRKVHLNEFNELRDQAYENTLIYKEKTKRIHDSKIKDRFFNVGDRVLLFNSRLKIFSSKLKTRWYGPFTITHVFCCGTVELSQIDGPNFKVNGHRLKHYFGEDIPKIVVPDLQTFPKDQCIWGLGQAK
nr:reverse transcriptase domain-containing protein [Tanacetum cinerariifolium]